METALRLPLHAIGGCSPAESSPVVSRVGPETPAPEGRWEQPPDPSCRCVHTNTHPPLTRCSSKREAWLWVCAHHEDSHQGQSSSSIRFLTKSPSETVFVFHYQAFLVPPTSNYILQMAPRGPKLEVFGGLVNVYSHCFSFFCPGLW